MKDKDYVISKLNVYRFFFSFFLGGGRGDRGSGNRSIIISYFLVENNIAGFD